MKNKITIKKISSDMIISGLFFVLISFVFLEYTVLSLPFFSTTAVFILSVAIFVVIILSKILVGQLDKYKIKFNKYALVYIIFLCIIYVNNYEIRTKNYRYTIIITLLVLMYVLGKEYANTLYQTMIVFLFLMGCVSVMATLFFWIFPDLYTPLVLNNVSTEYLINLRYVFNQGYQPGITINYSVNGIYLSLFLGVVFSGLIDNGNSNKIVNYVLFIVALLTLFLTSKRAHIVFAIFSMIVTYYISNVNAKAMRYIKVLAIIMGGFVGFIIAIQFVPELGMFIERIISSFNSDNFLEGRKVLYEYAIKLFEEKSFFGNGWGSYKYLAEMNIGQYNNAHNVFLQLLAEIGIVGFIIVVPIIISFCVRSIKKYSKAKRSFQEDVNYLSFTVYFNVFFVLYCMLGNPLYDDFMILIEFMVALKVTSYDCNKEIYKSSTT